MPISVVTNNHFQIMQTLLGSVRQSIKIISPFISCEMTNLLCQLKQRKPTVQIEVITRYIPSDFCKGVSSIFGLKDLINNGIDTFALSKLHTKLYLFDGAVALVGSANFTSGGFHFNNELSLHIQNDQNLIDELTAFYGSLYRLVSPFYKITLGRIDKTIQSIKRTKKKLTNQNESNELSEGWGAEPPENVYVPQTPVLATQVLLQQTVATATVGENIWLKFESSSSARLQATDFYSPTKWQKNMVTCFPAREKRGYPQIKADDLFFLAVVCYDNNGKEAQHIVGRGIFDSAAQDVSEQMIAKYSFMSGYPQFCKVKRFEFIDAPIGRCVPVKEMVHKLGRHFYASSMSPNAGNPQKVHYQKTQLYLTENAKLELDNQLDNLFELFGSKKV